MIALGFLLACVSVGPVVGLICFFLGRDSAVVHEKRADISEALRRSVR